MVPFCLHQQPSTVPLFISPHFLTQCAGLFSMGISWRAPFVLAKFRKGKTLVYKLGRYQWISMQKTGWLNEWVSVCLPLHVWNTHAKSYPNVIAVTKIKWITHSSLSYSFIFCLCTNMIFIYLLKVNAFRHSNKYAVRENHPHSHTDTDHALRKQEKRKTHAKDDRKCSLQFTLNVWNLLFVVHVLVHLLLPPSSFSSSSLNDIFRKKKFLRFRRDVRTLVERNTKSANKLWAAKKNLFASKITWTDFMANTPMHRRRMPSQIYSIYAWNWCHIEVL